MARVTVEDCLEVVDNQYDLVILAKERALQLGAGDKALVSEDKDKKTVIALREIGDKLLDKKKLENATIERAREHPEEIITQDQNQAEAESDAFEEIYKGEVSKSGQPILPSKRTRKVPLANSDIAEDDMDDESEEITEASEQTNN